MSNSVSNIRFVNFAYFSLIQVVCEIEGGFLDSN